MKNFKTTIIVFALSIFVLLFFPACTSNYADYLGESNFIKYSFENQLNSSGLSLDAKNFLTTNCLDEQFSKSPEKVINLCSQQINLEKSDLIIEHNYRSTLKVIIELCIYQGQNTGDEESIKYWMSACYYSYRYLFDKNLSPSFNQLNTPDTDIVINYYNYSLYKIFNYIQNKSLLNNENFTLPMLSGTVKFNTPYNNLPWKLNTFKNFFICFDYQAININENIFQKGLGIPLGGIPKKQDMFPKYAELTRLVKYLYPCTFLLKFDDKENQDHQIEATPEYLDFFKNIYYDIDNRKILLSNNYSSIIGQMVKKYPVDPEITYFFNPGDMLQKKSMGIYMLTPYDEDKIPVVLVHGFISNPQSMFQIYNTLMQYIEIRENYQFWFYFYPTGQPILLSSFILRGILDGIDKKFNSFNNASKFNDMILIGYSLGGLITQLAIQSSKGKYIEEKLFPKGLDTLNSDEIHRNRIKELLTFEPLPFVKKEIFISTPHGGAKMADWLGSQFLAGLALSPQDYYRDYKDTFRFMSKFARKHNEHIILGNALYNLIPSSEFISLTRSLPYSKNTERYSILGDKDKAGKLGGTDGVVPYSSTHLNNIRRETVIKSNHHSINQPACAKEILRILLDGIKKNNSTIPKISD